MKKTKLIRVQDDAHRMLKVYAGERLITLSEAIRELIVSKQDRDQAERKSD